VVSVIGAFYYLRIVIFMYVEQPAVGQPAPAWQPGVRLMVGVNGVAALVLAFFPGRCSPCARAC